MAIVYFYIINHKCIAREMLNWLPFSWTDKKTLSVRYSLWADGAITPKHSLINGRHLFGSLLHSRPKGQGLICCEYLLTTS